MPKVVRRTGVHSASGTLAAGPASVVKAGTAIQTDMVEPGTLSATVTTKAATSTLTLTPHWQVSADNTTYNDLGPANNAANVALSTGTSGADSAVTRVLDAPASVFGWPWVRVAAKANAVSGSAGDTYAIALNYVKRSVFK
jgi:hypothetical protein